MTEDQGNLTDPLDLDAEAERLADTMLDLGERLTDADPAVLREAYVNSFSGLTADGHRSRQKTGKQLRCKFQRAPSDYGRKRRFLIVG